MFCASDVTVNRLGLMDTGSEEVIFDLSSFKTEGFDDSDECTGVCIEVTGEGAFSFTVNLPFLTSTDRFKSM